MASLTPVYHMYQSKINKDIVYLGMNNDLGILKYTGSEFEFIGTIPHSGVSIRSVAEDNFGNIWIGTYRDGVIQLVPSDDIFKPKQILQYKTESGLPSLKNVLIYYLEGTMVFATEFGIYTFDYKQNKFIEDTRFKNMFQGTQKDVFSILEDGRGNFFYTQLVNKRGSIGFAIKNADASFTFNNKIFNKIPEIMVRSIYLDYDNSLWIGGTDGLFKVNLDEKLILRRSSILIFEKSLLNVIHVFSMAIILKPLVIRGILQKIKMALLNIK